MPGPYAQLSLLVGIAALLALLVLVVAVSTVALRIAATTLRMESIPAARALRIAGISTLVHVAIHGPGWLTLLALVNGSRNYTRAFGGNLDNLLMAAVGSVGLVGVLFVLAFTAALIRREVRRDNRYEQVDSEVPLKESPPMPLIDAMVLATTHYAMTMLFLALAALILMALFGLLR